MRFASLLVLGGLLSVVGCSGNSSSSSTAPISVAVGPSVVTLAGGQAQIFVAAVMNDSSNAGVTWALAGGVGSLSATTATGTTYLAPSGLATATTVTLTATSVKDTTKSAVATITVSPSTAVSVAVTPATASLALGSSQKLTAVVTGDVGSAGVVWSISQGPGTLSGSSTTAVTYVAPAGLPAAASATVTATSKTDSSKSASAVISLAAPTGPASQWVYYDSTGNLAYKTIANADNNGTLGNDRVMDFSTAGYMQGGTALPTATVQATVSASGDVTGAKDTANIQTALNSVGSMALNATTGLRGAVSLNAGTYYVNASLQISASGVVLRGAGSGSIAATNTVINMVAAATPYPLIVMGSTASPSYVGSATTITDAYVPSGATSIDVANATGLTVGSSVMIIRPVTQTWINFMGMNASTAPIDNCSGGGCNWISAGDTGLKTDRIITAISGNKITLDAPISDSIDSVYCGTNGATVQAFNFNGRISQVGVENLHAVAPVPANNLVPPTATYQLVTTNSVINAWIRNLTALDTLQSVDIKSYSKQVTVSNVAITHTVTQTQSAKFMEFYLESATQVLMDGVSDTADNMFFYSTSSTTQGPNVLRNGAFVGDTTIEPHQRWATGLLVENTTITPSPISGAVGGINFYNRGDYGSGHGWTIGWGVAWNTTTGNNTTVGTDLFQQPPGSQNWCIGCVGNQGKWTPPGGTTVGPQGAIDSSGTFVFPASLYQAQLTQRLGPGVVAQ